MVRTGVDVGLFTTGSKDVVGRAEVSELVEEISLVVVEDRMSLVLEVAVEV